jgi:glutamate--cysteine ligase
VDNVNFKDKNSLGSVAEAVDSTIDKITQKYEEYDISEDPFVFVKNNSGTYGLGIISVSSGKEIINLNSKNRKKMIYGKQGSRINSILIQEGIYTNNFVDNHSAEPVLYNVGGAVVGGFMRINPIKDKDKNLNSRGMVFENLIENELTKPIIIKNGKFSLYSMLTMVADLAIAFEHKQNMHDR